MPADPFDSIMRSLDEPMAIVTAAMGAERAGCLVGFHSQSSIDPARYCAWISKANHTYRVMLHSTYLAVHLLTVADLELARHFGALTGDDVDKFQDCDTQTGLFGLPLLTACANRMVVRRIALLDDGGDHVCVTAEPIEVTSSGPFTPLRFRDVDDLEPGHPAAVRPDPPTERAG